MEYVLTKVVDYWEKGFNKGKSRLIYGTIPILVFLFAASVGFLVLKEWIVRDQEERI